MEIAGTQPLDRASRQAMSGRAFVAGFALFVLIFGAALIYYQFYGHYTRVDGLTEIEAGDRTVPYFSIVLVHGEGRRP